jgi:cob(I)alamin adenosyltransferase
MPVVEFKMKRSLNRKGLVIINTGNGKGKTTAALGLVLRAVGHRMRIMIVQFIKGNFRYGELRSIRRLAPNVELSPRGRGCITIVCGRPSKASEEEHRQAALEAFHYAKEVIQSNRYDIVVLDEITYLVNFGFLPVEQLLELIRTRPPHLHLVLTGRNAHPALVEASDLVTEMREVKHPHQQGVKMQRGIEF